MQHGTIDMLLFCINTSTAHSSYGGRCSRCTHKTWPREQLRATYRRKIDFVLVVGVSLIKLCTATQAVRWNFSKRRSDYAQMYREVSCLRAGHGLGVWNRALKTNHFTGLVTLAGELFVMECFPVDEGMREEAPARSMSPRAPCGQLRPDRSGDRKPMR